MRRAVRQSPSPTLGQQVPRLDLLQPSLMAAALGHDVGESLARHFGSENPLCPE